MWINSDCGHFAVPSLSPDYAVERLTVILQIIITVIQKSSAVICCVAGQFSTDFPDSFHSWFHFG
jgi:hypothetical protein